MAGVVRIDALWKQAFATALAPARKSGSAALGSHTCAKTVLAFTRSLRWLKSAFHNRELARSDLRAVTVGAWQALSTTPRRYEYEGRPISDDAVIPNRARASNLQSCQYGGFLE
jgi:hypothetical protein